PKATLDAHSPALGPHLAARLDRMPGWYAAFYAVLVGALVEWRADALACAPAVLRGTHRAFGNAVAFAEMWRGGFGPDADLPDPEETPGEELLARLEATLGDRWVTPLFEGWLTVHRWEKASVAVLADVRVRRALGSPDGLDGVGAGLDELVRLADRLEPDFGDLRCIRRALLLWEDEPLLVLDRASGTAFRLRVSGVSGIYQLQTLLAGVLIGGGHLPGDPPSAEAVAISLDAPIPLGRPDDLPTAVECFNFAEPSGRWITGDLSPDRIPVVGGVRRLVLDPPVRRHHYRAVRFLPRVSARVDLEAVLSPRDAAPYFAGVGPLMTREEDLRAAARGR
ncbi:hypothetical protein, partial [Actinacidiphila rubida]